jgi:hypothetical protein
VLTLVLRRILAQRRLLVGVVAVVTLGTTLLGVGALLLGTTQDRAFTAGVRQAQPRDVDVTAFLVGLKGSDAPRRRAHRRRQCSRHAASDVDEQCRVADAALR